MASYGLVWPRKASVGLVRFSVSVCTLYSTGWSVSWYVTRMLSGGSFMPPKACGRCRARRFVGARPRIALYWPRIGPGLVLASYWPRIGPGLVLAQARMASYWPRLGPVLTKARIGLVLALYWPRIGLLLASY